MSVEYQAGAGELREWGTENMVQQFYHEALDLALDTDNKDMVDWVGESFFYLAIFLLPDLFLCIASFLL